MRSSFFAACLLTIPLTACSAMRSDRIDISSAVNRPGVEYAAPKALLRIELVEQNGVLALEISEPILIGDPEASYVLSASSGLLANQEYRLVVEPQTRLLTYINSRSEGQADTILTNLARSLGGVGEAARDENSLGRGSRRVIFSRIVDPFAYPGCDFGVNCAFGGLAGELRTVAFGALDCGEANRREVNPCPALRNQDFFEISLTPLFEVASGGGGRNSARARNDCRHSICYRAPAPYALRLRVGDHTDISEIVSFPNEAPVIGLDIPAGVFANAHARVELYQGMPARYIVDRDNELVAITLLPLDIVKAGFQAVSEVVQLRINYNTGRGNMIQSDRNLRAIENTASAASEQVQPDPALEGSDAAGNARDENNATPPEQSDGDTAPWADNFVAISADAVNMRGSQLQAAQLFLIALDGRATEQNDPGQSGQNSAVLEDEEPD